MNELQDALQRWTLDVGQVRRQMYRAATPRERERWHALWLALQGWPQVRVAEALGRNPHTIGEWLDTFCREGPTALAFVQTGGPPALNPDQQALLKAAVQRPPSETGIPLADGNWKVVRRFVQERFSITLGRSSCLNYLHRLGFVVKRPKKRLLKADETKRAVFVEEYTALRTEAQVSGAKHFFADEAHFYAEPLVVFWDNAPTHGGDPIRSYLSMPDLRLRLVRLPASSPDCNADEAIWDWVREEVTANTCWGTAAKVREQVDAFFAELVHRTEEVKRRCRRVLQAKADALDTVAAVTAIIQHGHADPTLALV